MTRNHHNEEAAAGIFTFVLLFLLMGILFLACGLAVDKFFGVAASMTSSGVGVSELMISTLNLMTLVFRAEPIIFLVLIGLNFWVSEMRSDSGMADTSTMIIAVVEAITITFILMVFTFSGNYALSQVVVFVNVFPVQNADLSLYSAVQYIQPAFSGIMFLILIGVVTQLAMTCVRVTDYRGYN